MSNKTLVIVTVTITTLLLTACFLTFLLAGTMNTLIARAKDDGVMLFVSSMIQDVKKNGGTSTLQLPDGSKFTINEIQTTSITTPTTQSESVTPEAKP